MNRKVYFSGSISGGRQDVLLYQRIISLINETDTVLTEHIGNPDYSTAHRTLADEQQVYRQDTDWLKTCDLVIAECSRPSLGVGYEMAFAEALGKPVHIFARQGIHLSAMLRGDPYFKVNFYQTEEELKTMISTVLSADISPE